MPLTRLWWRRSPGKACLSYFLTKLSTSAPAIGPCGPMARPLYRLSRNGCIAHSPFAKYSKEHWVRSFRPLISSIEGLHLRPRKLPSRQSKPAGEHRGRARIGAVVSNMTARVLQRRPCPAPFADPARSPDGRPRAGLGRCRSCSLHSSHRARMLRRIGPTAARARRCLPRVQAGARWPPHGASLR